VSTGIKESKTGSPKKRKILLAILPYWSPLIPPAGLAALKSYLQPRGYNVKAVDMIAKKESLEFYYGYFNVLKKNIPPEKRGTFYNIGHDLLENHMMAYLHSKDAKEYTRLVKLLVYNYYYVKVEDNCILELDQVINYYLKKLRRYFLYLLKYELPDVVGITVYKATLPASLFVLKLTKENYPHIKTIIGGGIFADSHALGSPNLGQGERLLLEYLRGQLPESKRVYTPEDINWKTLGFEDIDLPDYTDFNTYKYSHLPATASISCMYQCTFCNESKFWGKFIKKPPFKTAADMRKLYEKYKRQLFMMTDSLLNPVINDLAREMINQKVPLYYDTYFRVDNLSTNIKNTSMWRKGGLYRVRLGVESGSQRILDKMGKGITTDQIKEALSNLAFTGIKTTTYWLIGHPGETEEDFQKTLDIIEELKDCIWQAECNPFRYYFNGQNSSDEWAKYRVRLYPEKAKDMLIFEEWTLNLEPSRQVVYDRVNRFIRHCKKLGIPNPYSAFESFEADKRWQKLQKNAVPPLEHFVGENSYVDENKYIKAISLAVDTRKNNPDFNF
jgi:hypothetical protein